MTDTPSRRPGLRDELVAALGQIDIIPPVAHRRQQADNVLKLLYQEWPWLRAEAEDLAEARQHAAAIAAQRDRLRQRMNTLADRWDTALAVDKPYARTLRNEISVAPFDPEGAMVVREYTERGRRLWVFRCWGTDTCDGWLGLGHHTQTSAKLEQERHVAEAHAEPDPTATQATDRTNQLAAAFRDCAVGQTTAGVHVYLSTGCLHGDHDYCKSMTGLNGAKRPGECKKCAAKCICGCHGGPNPT